MDIALSQNEPLYQTILDLDQRIQQQLVPKKYDQLPKKPGVEDPTATIALEGICYRTVTLPLRSYQMIFRREVGRSTPLWLPVL